MQAVTLPALAARRRLTSLVFSADEKRAALYATAAGSRAISISSISRPAGARLDPQPQRRIRPDDLVEGRWRVSTPTTTSSPGLLFKPHQAGADAARPALVWCTAGRVTSRGSPTTDCCSSWSTTATSFRDQQPGSQGYGRTFYSMR